jgi:hypothetical protein
LEKLKDLPVFDGILGMEAGPMSYTFRDRKGEIINLRPFSLPILLVKAPLLNIFALNPCNYQWALFPSLSLIVEGAIFIQDGGPILFPIFSLGLLRWDSSSNANVQSNFDVSSFGWDWPTYRTSRVSPR